MVERMTSVAVAVIAAIALGGCGGDDSTSSGGSEAVTPEVAQQRLQDAGYTTGEIITNGANMGVAQNGKIDADAYLGVENDPDGNSLYVGIYFFDNEKDPAVFDQEQEDDEDSWTEVVGTRAYNISGSQSELTPVIAAAEAQ